MKCEINDKSVQLNIVQYITDCRVSQYAMQMFIWWALNTCLFKLFFNI